MENSNIATENYQVLVTNISWCKDAIGQYRAKHDNYDTLPVQFALDIPENILNHRTNKNYNVNDAIETFVYNFLTKKYEHEVNCCSIWLPLEK